MQTNYPTFRSIVVVEPAVPALEVDSFVAIATVPQTVDLHQSVQNVEHSNSSPSWLVVVYCQFRYQNLGTLC